MGQFARITLPLAAVNFLNQGNRALIAVIGPVLALEFGLSAAQLGLLAAVFFVAYALVQMPIGIALDLYGARRVQMTLCLVAGIGFVLSAVAPDPFTLGLSRFITGAGVAAGLMAMLKAHAQWYPKERVAGVTGAGLFLAATGGLAATAPAQALLPVLGWRGIFWVLSGLAVLVSLWIAISVPERPPGTVAVQRRSMLREVAEFGRIFSDRPFLRFLPAVMVLSALNFTFQGLWAGPWLRDVAGLDDAPRAAVLFLYALGMAIGSLVTGQATSRAQALGYNPMMVPYVGIGLMIVVQALLIVHPGGFWTLSVLWFLFAFGGSAGPAAYAVIGQGFPPELAGRVATAINGSMLVLVFLLQYVIGWILDLWPRTASGGWDPAGYGWAVGLTVAMQAGATAWIAIARPKRAT